jgi:hypothetical protein
MAGEIIYKTVALRYYFFSEADFKKSQPLFLFLINFVKPGLVNSNPN